MSVQRAENPANGEAIASFEVSSESVIEERLKRAQQAQRTWAKTSLSERSAALRALAYALRTQKAALARQMTLEMGKLLADAESEVEKCAWVCEHYAEQGPRLLSEQPVKTDASHSGVVFRPLGVVLAIMPWNFPMWQFYRCAAPALMAGNALVLKHASNVPGSAASIGKVCGDALPVAGLVEVLHVDGKTASELIARDEIAAVTLTGSTGAGAKVAEAAGAALKKCVLELGGSDPYIVLADADVEHAAKTCVASRMTNNGQSCIAAKRFIVEDAVYDRFCDLVESHMKNKRLGDPLSAETTLGPMARVDLRDELHDQVRRSVKAGAKLTVGGEVPEGPGAFYPATVLRDVEPGMAAFDEELFGPVAACIRAHDEHEAIALANRSEFGLGGAIFTRDVKRGWELAADELEVGCAFVNDFVRSDPRLPFGGIKRSGYGRELGDFGIHEFVNIKTVYQR